MKITVQETIDAPIDQVFEVFSDVENTQQRISAISKVEILSKVKSGKGVRWRETRTMFGKEATEEMEITKADKPNSYTVKAASHGAAYTSIYSFRTQDDSTIIELEFTAVPTSISGQLMSIMGILFKGATKKVFRADIAELKSFLEG